MIVVVRSAPAPAVGTIPTVRFCNHDLPAAARFEAYRADAIGFAEPIEREPGTPSRANDTAWSVGAMVVKRTDSPPLDRRRTAAMARRDGLDHRLLNLPRHSRQRMTVGDHEAGISAARPGLIARHRPFRLERAEAEQGWVHAFVARDAVPGVEMPGDLNGAQALATPMGQLLVGFLRDVAGRLHEMPGAAAPALSNAAIALLRATLAPCRHARAEAHPYAEAGLSRSSLHRLFEPRGGVTATIRAERLTKSRRLREDPDERRTIGRIGEAVGGCEPSVFGRAFRQRYGVSPREAREAAQHGLGPAAPVVRAAGQGFLGLGSRIEFGRCR